MMRFRQPSDLARAVNYLIDQLQAGESLELIFTQQGQDTRVWLYLLEVITEVARVRKVSVAVSENI